MSTQIVPIWTPADYREAFEQAAEARAAQCLATLSLDGEHYDCDNTEPHHTLHTSAVLRARWVDTAVTK